MTKTTRGRSQDRKLVAGDQPHEVRHEARKAGVSKEEVKAAVKAAGNSRKNVEQHVGAKP